MLAPAEPHGLVLMRLPFECASQRYAHKLGQCGSRRAERSFICCSEALTRLRLKHNGPPLGNENSETEGPLGYCSL